MGNLRRCKLAFNIRTKIIGGYAVIVLLVALVGFAGMYTMKSIENEHNEIISGHLNPAVITGMVANRIGFIHSNSLLHLFSKSIDDMGRYESEIDAGQDKINRDIETIRTLLVNPDIIDKLDTFHDSWKLYMKIWHEQVVPMSRANLDKSVFELSRKRGAAGSAELEAVNNLNELLKMVVSEADHRLSVSGRLYRKRLYVSLAVSLGVIILGLFIGIRQSTLIARPVNAVASAAKRLTKGDLDQRIDVKTGDEIEILADSFNVMAGKLKQKINKLHSEINVRKQAEEDLKEYRNQLEEKVKERTQDLEEREAKLRAIYEAAQDVSLIIIDGQDPDMPILEFSPGAENIFGYHRSEIKGTPVSVLHLPKDTARFPAVFQQMKDRGEGSGEEITMVRKTGEKFFAMSSTYPLYNKKKEMYAVLSVHIDIDKQKKLQVQLNHSQKLEAIGSLAGGIAHDFNNILSAIIGYSQLAMDRLPKDSPAQKDLAQVYKAGERARNLVMQILTFSRQKEQNAAPIQIGPIIKEVLKFLKATLPSSIEIRQEIMPDAGHVLADPTQIHQVLMNLCTNAAHAMDQTGGELTVTLSDVTLDQDAAETDPDLLPGKYLKLTVADTGHGIAPEILPKIFEPYFTTKKRGQGTGLGLATVHGIIKSYGGGITVSSTPGQGTTFDLYFPVIETPAESAPEKPAPATAAKSSACILFVDDEPGIADLGGQVLGDKKA
ncbi:ATP-binding protein [Desulfotignum phosphitoxidans]|uniref:ATP-binding protein n=1 Tax=Desulfotignum phosphitoxidans TaxID=190898 RepID=UPI000A035074